MARSRAEEETGSGLAAVTEEQSLDTPATTAAPSPFGWSREREFHGPVRFETIGPFPDAEGEPIKDGKEFLAGPKVATALWHSGMVEAGRVDHLQLLDDIDRLAGVLRLLGPLLLLQGGPVLSLPQSEGVGQPGR